MIAIAITSAALAAAMPPLPVEQQPIVIFEGKFNVTYTPIYCSRAPCPPGTYHAISGNKLVASFKSYTIEGEPADDVPRYMEGDGMGFEGKIDVENGVAVITARRRVNGLWKVEGELPPAPAERTTGAKSVTIVNRTGDVVREIYLSPAHDDNWGPYRNSDNLSIKQKMTLDLPTDDCLYDIRMSLGLRPAEELKRQDLCKDPQVIADRKGTLIERR